MWLRSRIKKSCGVPRALSYLRKKTFEPPLRAERGLVKGNVKCGREGCVTCEHLVCTSVFKGNQTGERYNMLQVATCATKNVVYLITCSACDQQYVGETKRKLSTRFGEHLRNIRKEKTQMVGRHACFEDEKNIKIQVIDKCEQGQSYRRSRENFWIHELETLQPQGLNTQGLFTPKRG